MKENLTPRIVFESLKQSIDRDVAARVCTRIEHRPDGVCNLCEKRLKPHFWTHSIWVDISQNVDDVVRRNFNTIYYRIATNFYLSYVAHSHS